MMNISYLQKQEIITGTLLDLISVKDINFSKNGMNKQMRIIDEVAERARTLNGRSLGTLAEFVEHGSIQENPGKYPDELTMISNLFADHEQIIRSLRTDADRCEEYHDMGTNDFLIGVMEKHEKMAWMLRAHLDMV